MTKIILLGCVVLCSFISFQANAESQDTDRAERINLSKDLHDIRNVRERINATILQAAETIPPADREDFQRYVQLRVNYDALEEKSIGYAAEVYSADELRAMIAYFGSPAGKSAEAKGAQFGEMIADAIIKEIDAAILAAKYEGIPPESLPQKTGR